MPPAIALDASRIAPKLYVGSHPQSSRELATLGFRLHVLAAEELCTPQQLARLGPLPPTLIQAIAGIDDSDRHGLLPREAAAALQAAQVAAEHVVRGQRVLISCQKGMNRSALMAALALQRLYGLPGRVAMTQVRRARGPAVGGAQNVLFNPHFAAFLARG